MHKCKEQGRRGMTVRILQKYAKEQGIKIPPVCPYQSDILADNSPDNFEYALYCKGCKNLMPKKLNSDDEWFVRVSDETGESLYQHLKKLAVTPYKFWKVPARKAGIEGMMKSWRKKISERRLKNLDTVYNPEKYKDDEWLNHWIETGKSLY